MSRFADIIREHNALVHEAGARDFILDQPEPKYVLVRRVSFDGQPAVPSNFDAYFTAHGNQWSKEARHGVRLGVHAAQSWLGHYEMLQKKAEARLAAQGAPDGPRYVYSIEPALVQESLKDDIEAEAAKVEEPASPEQAEAGNYAKGHIHLHGLSIAIENAKGSTRSGEDKDGKPWSVTMPAHYGYIKGTEGKDKDHLDVYIGEHPGAFIVYVVNQHKLDGPFDEHKLMLGFESKEEALSTYDAAFSGDLGPKLRQEVISMTVPQLKTWLEKGDHKKPCKLEEALDPKDFIMGQPDIWQSDAWEFRGSKQNEYGNEIRLYRHRQSGVSFKISDESDNEYVVHAYDPQGGYHTSEYFRQPGGISAVTPTAAGIAEQELAGYIRRAARVPRQEGVDPREFIERIPNLARGMRVRVMREVPGVCKAGDTGYVLEYPYDGSDLFANVEFDNPSFSDNSYPFAAVELERLEEAVDPQQFIQGLEPAYILTFIDQSPGHEGVKRYCRINQHGCREWWAEHESPEKVAQATRFTAAEAEREAERSRRFNLPVEIEVEPEHNPDTHVFDTFVPYPDAEDTAKLNTRGMTEAIDPREFILKQKTPWYIIRRDENKEPALFPLDAPEPRWLYAYRADGDSVHWATDPKHADSFPLAWAKDIAAQYATGASELIPALRKTDEAMDPREFIADVPDERFLVQCQYPKDGKVITRYFRHTRDPHEGNWVHVPGMADRFEYEEAAGVARYWESNHPNPEGTRYAVVEAPPGMAEAMDPKQFIDELPDKRYLIQNSYTDRGQVITRFYKFHTDEEEGYWTFDKAKAARLSYEQAANTVKGWIARAPNSHRSYSVIHEAVDPRDFIASQPAPLYTLVWPVSQEHERTMYYKGLPPGAENYKLRSHHPLQLVNWSSVPGDAGLLTYDEAKYALKVVDDYLARTQANHPLIGSIKMVPYVVKESVDPKEFALAQPEPRYTFTATNGQHTYYYAGYRFEHIWTLDRNKQKSVKAWRVEDLLKHFRLVDAECTCHYTYTAIPYAGKPVKEAVNPKDFILDQPEMRYVVWLWTVNGMRAYAYYKRDQLEWSYHQKHAESFSLEDAQDLCRANAHQGARMTPVVDWKQIQRGELQLPEAVDPREFITAQPEPKFKVRLPASGSVVTPGFYNSEAKYVYAYWHHYSLAAGGGKDIQWSYEPEKASTFTAKEAQELCTLHRRAGAEMTPLIESVALWPVRQVESMPEPPADPKDFIMAQPDERYILTKEIDGQVRYYQYPATQEEGYWTVDRNRAERVTAAVADDVLPGWNAGGTGHKYAAELADPQMESVDPKDFILDQPDDLLRYRLVYKNGDTTYYRRWPHSTGVNHSLDWSRDPLKAQKLTKAQADDELKRLCHYYDVEPGQPLNAAAGFVGQFDYEVIPADQMPESSAKAQEVAKGLLEAEPVAEATCNNWKAVYVNESGKLVAALDLQETQENAYALARAHRHALAEPTALLFDQAGSFVQETDVRDFILQDDPKPEPGKAYHLVGTTAKGLYYWREPNWNTSVDGKWLKNPENATIYNYDGILKQLDWWKEVEKAGGSTVSHVFARPAETHTEDDLQEAVDPKDFILAQPGVRNWRIVTYGIDGEPVQMSDVIYTTKQDILDKVNALIRARPQSKLSVGWGPAEDFDERGRRIQRSDVREGVDPKDFIETHSMVLELPSVDGKRVRFEFVPHGRGGGSVEYRRSDDESARRGGAVGWYMLKSLERALAMPGDKMPIFQDSVWVLSRENIQKLADWIRPVVFNPTDESMDPKDFIEVNEPWVVVYRNEPWLYYYSKDKRDNSHYTLDPAEATMMPEEEAISLAWSLCHRSSCDVFKAEPFSNQRAGWRTESIDPKDFIMRQETTLALTNAAGTQITAEYCLSKRADEQDFVTLYVDGEYIASFYTDAFENWLRTMPGTSMRLRQRDEWALSPADIQKIVDWLERVMPPSVQENEEVDRLLAQPSADDEQELLPLGLYHKQVRMPFHATMPRSFKPDPQKTYRPQVSAKDFIMRQTDEMYAVREDEADGTHGWFDGIMFHDDPARAKGYAYEKAERIAFNLMATQGNKRVLVVVPLPGAALKEAVDPKDFILRSEPTDFRVAGTDEEGVRRYITNIHYQADGWTSNVKSATLFTREEADALVKDIVPKIARVGNWMKDIQVEPVYNTGREGYYRWQPMKEGVDPREFALNQPDAEYCVVAKFGDSYKQYVKSELGGGTFDWVNDKGRAKRYPLSVAQQIAAYLQNDVVPGSLVYEPEIAVYEAVDPRDFIADQPAPDYIIKVTRPDGKVSYLGIPDRPGAGFYVNVAKERAADFTHGEATALVAKLQADDVIGSTYSMEPEILRNHPLQAWVEPFRLPEAVDPREFALEQPGMPESHYGVTFNRRDGKTGYLGRGGWGWVPMARDAQGMSKEGAENRAQMLRTKFPAETGYAVVDLNDTEWAAYQGGGSTLDQYRTEAVDPKDFILGVQPSNWQEALAMEFGFKPTDEETMQYWSPNGRVLVVVQTHPSWGYYLRVWHNSNLLTALPIGELSGVRATLEKHSKLMQEAVDLKDFIDDQPENKWSYTVRGGRDMTLYFGSPSPVPNSRDTWNVSGAALSTHEAANFDVDAWAKKVIDWIWQQEVADPMPPLSRIQAKRRQLDFVYYAADSAYIWLNRKLKEAGYDSLQDWLTKDYRAQNPIQEGVDPREFIMAQPSPKYYVMAQSGAPGMVQHWVDANGFWNQHKQMAKGYDSPEQAERVRQSKEDPVLARNGFVTKVVSSGDIANVPESQEVKDFILSSPEPFLVKYEQRPDWADVSPNWFTVYFNGEEIWKRDLKREYTPEQAKLEAEDIGRQLNAKHAENPFVLNRAAYDHFQEFANWWQGKGQPMAEAVDPKNFILSMEAVEPKDFILNQPEQVLSVRPWSDGQRNMVTVSLYDFTVYDQKLPSHWGLKRIATYARKLEAFMLHRDAVEPLDPDGEVKRQVAERKKGESYYTWQQLHRRFLDWWRAQSEHMRARHGLYFNMQESADAREFILSLSGDEPRERFSPVKPGNGMNAPLRVVLRRGMRPGEWVTRIENMQVGGETSGNYFLEPTDEKKAYARALDNFRERCDRLGVDYQDATLGESVDPRDFITSMPDRPKFRAVYYDEAGQLLSINDLEGQEMDAQAALEAAQDDARALAFTDKRYRYSSLKFYVVEPDGKLTQLRLASDVGLYDRFSESVDPKDFILAQPDESFRAEADDDGFVNVWWTPGKAYAKEYPGIWKLYKGRQMVQQRAYPEDMPKEFLQKAARLVQQFLRVQDVATPFMPSTSDFWGQFRNWYLASDLQVRRDLEHKLALLRHGQPVQETAKDFIMAQPAPRYVIVNDDGAYYYRFGRHVEFHIGYYPDFENVKHAIFSEQQLPNELENAKRYCPSAKPEIWIEDRGQSFQGPAVPPHEVDEAIDPKDFITTQEAPGVWYAVSAMIDGQQCYFKTDGFRCNTSPGLYTADAAQGIADDYEAWLRGEGEPLRHRAYEKSATDIKVVPAQTDLPEAIDPKDFIMGLPGIKSVAEEYGLPMVEEHLHTPGTGGKPGTTEEWMERAGYVRYQRFTGSMPLPVPVNRWDSEHHRIESLEVSVLYWESKPGWTLYPHQLRIDIHGRSKKMSHESEHGLASNLEFRLRRLRDTLARMRVGKHTRLERVLASLGYKSL